MTDSRPWHRRIWRLAGPMILSNISVPLVGAVDTAVMGHLPDPAYIGAIALGATIFSFVYWGFGFLRMGTTGFLAQAQGAGQTTEASAVVARVLLLAGALGLLIIAVQWPVSQLAFWLLEGSNEVESFAHQYFTVRVWSAPATLINYALVGALIGLQNTRATLYMQLLLNGLNITLDLVFVLGLHWNVPGVAAASVISDYAASGFGLWLLGRSFPALSTGWQRARVLDRNRLLAMFKVNANIFVRTLCLVFAFAWFTAQGTRMGDTVLAVNAVLMQFQNMMTYALDGFAFATEALTGSAYGAQQREPFRQAVRVSTIWAALIATAVALIYWLFGTRIVALMTDIPSIRAEAARYLPWVIAAPLVSVWSFQLDGIFIGTTHTGEMRNGMLIATATFVASAWLLMQRYGNHGLWLAFLLFMVVRAMTLGWWYRRINASLAPAAD